MLEPGHRLNHYEIVRLLGKGGMGEVYLARDSKLGRQVALKVLPSDIAAEGERHQRFEREARSIAALQHPNIVTLHAIEEAEGVSFLVMELIDGQPLADAIPRGGFTLERFLDIAVPLADAVAAAHAGGITHRDLKPANVLLDDQGRPQVLDFGLAKVADGAVMGAESLEPTEALTGDGKIVGTIAYMSPEQVEGRPVDPRSDIFSLGVMFYEMTTGVRPFEGDTSMSVLTAILRDEPTPVTEHKERLPRYLGRVVRRCLQKDPSRRYQSALDLRNDLVDLKEELASGELATPHGPAPTSKARPWWLPIAVGLAIVAAAVVWWTSRRDVENSGEPRGFAYQVRRVTVRGSPRSSAISPDGRYVVYASEEVGQRSLRLQQISSGSDVELTAPVDWDVYLSGLAFSPDGEYVRYVETPGAGSGTIWEIPVLGGARRKLLDELAIGPAFSPDGGRVAFVPFMVAAGRWRQLDVVSFADGARQTIFELSEAEADIEDIAWSPDGERLAFNVGGPNGDHLFLLPSAGGEASRVPGDAFFSIGDLCWTPIGDQLVVVGAPRQSRHQPWLVDPVSGARRQLVGEFNSYDGCSSSADGRLTATVREEERTQIWLVDLADPRAARSVSTSTGRTDGSDHVAWLDLETLVYAAPDGDTWNLWQVPTEGGTSIRLTSQGATTPAVSRSGRVVFGSGWEVEERQGIYTLEGAGGGEKRLSPSGLFAERPTLSPDGEWLFYELLTGDRIRFVRAPWAGGEPEVLTDRLAHLASFSPDGRRIALHVLDPELERWQTAIFPIEGRPETFLDVHSETFSPWAGNDALFVSRTVDGAANIYRLDLADLSEEQVTFFADGEIFSFEVSPDLTRLAVGRGEILNDLLLIEGLLGSPADDGQ